MCLIGTETCNKGQQSNIRSGEIFWIVPFLTKKENCFLFCLETSCTYFIGKKSRVNKMAKQARPLMLEKNKRKLTKKKVLMINFFCKKKLKANIVEVSCM